jgi:hypothetical protein
MGFVTCIESKRSVDQGGYPLMVLARGLLSEAMCMWVQNDLHDLWRSDSQMLHFNDTILLILRYQPAFKYQEAKGRSRRPEALPGSISQGFTSRLCSPLLHPSSRPSVDFAPSPLDHATARVGQLTANSDSNC